MNLAHLLLRKSLEHPDRPAVFAGTQIVATHAQWAKRVARVGAHMCEAGLQPGDRVVLFMRNHPRCLELLFGAWWAGLVARPCTPPTSAVRRVAWARVSCRSTARTKAP